MFKKMLRALGVGGPTVDTVLGEGACVPGSGLSGEVRIGGANGETEIQHITLILVIGVENEHGDDGAHAVEIQRVMISEPFVLAEGEHRAVPFTLELPWEMPVTVVNGQPLPGAGVGLRTEVAVAKAVDKGDADPVWIQPLESQQRVIDAFFALGCQLRNADVEHGQIYGVHQQFPFYQEIEFFPPAQYAGRIGEIELTFIARPDDLDIVLEADKRGGLFQQGHEAFGRFHRSHEAALTTDWVAEITAWLEAVAERGAAAGHVFHEHGHEHGHSGPGMGGMLAAGAAGVAAGVVGGMVVGEVIDEVGDFFEGDEG